jgi:hypothetical protein
MGPGKMVVVVVHFLNSCGEQVSNLRVHSNNFTLATWFSCLISSTEVFSKRLSSKGG